VELEAYIDASRAGGVLTYSVKAGEMDLATDSGQLIARMLGAAARYESDQKATRIRRASEQAIRAGKWTGGTRPFGWDIVDGVPALNPVESKALADACGRVLAGDSLGSIIRDMNEARITTTRGKSWGYAQLAQALERPRNAGLADLHGEIVGPSTFPAIVTENIWRGVCAVLRDPSRRRSQSNKAVHLLAGIAQCHCGEYVRSATVTTRSGEKYRNYRCGQRGPGHVSKRIDFVDRVVNKVIVDVRAAHDKIKMSGAGPSAEAVKLELEATALRKRQEDAAVQAALGQIPMHMLGAINAVIEKELASVIAKMARIEEAAARQVPAEIFPVPEDSPYAVEWSNMHIDDRRDYLRSVCNVVLLPHGSGSTKVFNPDTVQFVRKSAGEGPGPLAVEEIARLASVTDARAGTDGGWFLDLNVGPRSFTYGIPGGLRDPLETEDQILGRLVPLEEDGAELLSAVIAETNRLTLGASDQGPAA